MRARARVRSRRRSSPSTSSAVAPRRRRRFRDFACRFRLEKSSNAVHVSENRTRRARTIASARQRWGSCPLQYVPRVREQDTSSENNCECSSTFGFVSIAVRSMCPRTGHVEREQLRVLVNVIVRVHCSTFHVSENTPRRRRRSHRCASRGGARRGSRERHSTFD